MNENEKAVKEELVDFLAKDYEQIWINIRHRDGIRIEWLKFYFGLITATGAILLGLYSTTNQGTFIEFIYENRNVIALLFLSLEFVGFFALLFHTVTRMRNITLLKRADLLRYVLLAKYDASTKLEQLSANPRWVSFWGTDAVTAYMLSFLLAFFLGISLMILNVTSAIAISIAFVFWIVLCVFYQLIFIKRSRNSTESGKDKK